MKNGIWHRVIKDKYLPHGTMTRWLRSATTSTTQGSQTWRNLLKSLHIILHWLAWSPGSGHSIILGKDLILGMGKDSILSEDLVVSLNQKNVYYLYQASRDLCPGTICSIWLDSEDLGLAGDLALEWEMFRRALIDSGVQLLDRPDVLKWTGGDYSGQLTVKNVYNAIATKQWIKTIGGWRKKLWLWDCPQKIKLFVWLVVENKILTWENLQLRGHIGPGLCHLCKSNWETANHLFVNCPFTISVWDRIKAAQSLSSGWNGATVAECFKNWNDQNLSYPSLPAFICWYIWIERNYSIFESGNPSIQKVVHKSLGAVGGSRKKVKEQITRALVGVYTWSKNYWVV
jgi:hypothetical protein